MGTENRKYADSLFRFISIHRYTHLLRQEIPIAHEWCTCNQATDNQESGHCARGYRFSSSLSSSPAGYHAFSRSSEILSPTKSGNWARVDVWSSMCTYDAHEDRCVHFSERRTRACRPFSCLGRDIAAKGARRGRGRERKKMKICQDRGGKDEQLSFRPPSSLEKKERRDGGWTGVEEGWTGLQTGAMIRAWNSPGVFNSLEIWFTNQRLVPFLSRHLPPPPFYLSWSLVFKHLTIFFWILFFFESGAISDNSGLFRRIPTWRSLNWEQKVWRLFASDTGVVRVDIVYVLRGKENETFVFENIFATMSQK